MASAVMLQRVALVRTDVLEEFSASIVRVTRIGEAVIIRQVGGPSYPTVPRVPTQEPFITSLVVGFSAYYDIAMLC
jgi:hypothetical protein